MDRRGFLKALLASAPAALLITPALEALAYADTPNGPIWGGHLGKGKHLVAVADGPCVVYGVDIRHECERPRILSGVLFEGRKKGALFVCFAAGQNSHGGWVAGPDGQIIVFEGERFELFVELAEPAFVGGILSTGPIRSNL